MQPIPGRKTTEDSCRRVMKCDIRLWTLEQKRIEELRRKVTADCGEKRQQHTANKAAYTSAGHPLRQAAGKTRRHRCGIKANSEEKGAK